MQAALPLATAQQFFSQVQAQAGHMQNKEFEKWQSTAAIYKATFERATLLFSLSLDTQNKVNGFYLKPYPATTAALSKIERVKTSLLLPFTGEWYVYWGGDTREQNYHVDYGAQQGAFDLVKMDAKGKTFKTDGKKNEDYYAFSQPITAPSAGVIIKLQDGLPDNTPGQMDKSSPLGNHVMIKTNAGEYLLLAHLKQHSIKVKSGATIKAGQTLGLCGNSGNTSEPHLHFHGQNGPELSQANGLKSYFSRLVVNNKSVTDYSPVKGDLIKNSSQ
jgi:murein DD-endopeptidase MepM/ murein hydrolase activator NlpD